MPLCKIIECLPDDRHRRSIRLDGYDIPNPGGYFVTVVTLWRECLFGKILGGEMSLNALGRIVVECWDEPPMARNSAQPS
jgi:putative transposase